jgi:hypothetical protein
MTWTKNQAGRRLPWLAALALIAARPAAAACGVTPADRDGNGTLDLEIKGTLGPNTLVLEDDGTNVAVSLDCNNDGDFADATLGEVNGTAFAGVETLVVALGGVDAITYVQTGAWSGVVRSVLLALGSGGNTVLFEGSAAISGRSSFVVDLVGGANRDVVTVDFAAAPTTDSLLGFYGDLAGGQDVLTVRLPPASGSVADVDLLLGSGNNVATVEAAGAVSASSFRANVEGNKYPTQIDKLRVVVSGSFSNNARFDYAGYLLDGDDRFAASVPVDTFQALTGAEVRLRADGGIGRDLLSLDGGAAAGPATVNGLFQAVLRGGPANDAVSIDWVGLTGTGTFRARGNGGLQRDAVMLGLVTDAGSANRLDLALQGSRGGDTIFAGIFDLGGAGFGPLGNALADGGPDTDTCLVTGSGAERINCEK